jgi:hypothetical protein
MMSTQEPVYEDDMVENDWPALAWIVFAAIVAVSAFLLAPMP